MLRRAPRLLTAVTPSVPAAANLFLQTPTHPSPHLLLVLLHHAPTADNARHLLDGTPRGAWASSIVRALRGGAPLEADAIASLHCSSIKPGAVLDPPVRTSLLAAYARRDADVGAALALFHEAADPDLIRNAAVGALTRSCRLGDVVVLFRRMVSVLGALDSITVVVMLSGASRARDLDLGMALHGVAFKRRLDTDLNLCNSLMDMYAKCGCFCASEAVFQGMPCRDTCSWNSMIGGSMFNELFEVSAHHIREMVRLSIQKDDTIRYNPVFYPFGRFQRI